MTHGLALELALHNILCNAIVPRSFLTEMNIPIKNFGETTKFVVEAVW